MMLKKIKHFFKFGGPDLKAQWASVSLERVFVEFFVYAMLVNL